MGKIINHVSGQGRHGVAIPMVWILIVLTALAGLMRGAGDDRTVATSLSATQLQMAHALHAVTRPGEPLVTDDQYVAALADRTVLPQLVDTSQVRIVAGYVRPWYRSPWALSSGQIERLITHAHVRFILFASGRFDLIPGFRAWVAAHFQPIIQFGDARTLYRVPRAERAP